MTTERHSKKIPPARLTLLDGRHEAPHFPAPPLQICQWAAAEPPSQNPADACVVRAYQPHDRAAVIELCADPAWPEPFLTRENLPEPDGDHAESRGQLWVAEVGGKIVGLIGVLHDGLVAQVRRLHVESLGHPQAELISVLLGTALRFCRSNGLLKVVVEAPIHLEAVQKLIAGCGFQLGRRKHEPGRDWLELYVNLYQKPVAS